MPFRSLTCARSRPSALSLSPRVAGGFDNRCRSESQTSRAPPISRVASHVAIPRSSDTIAVPKGDARDEASREGMDKIRNPISVSWVEMSAVVVLTMLITGSSLDTSAPRLSFPLRIAAYLSVAFVIVHLLYSRVHRGSISFRRFRQAYGLTFLLVVLVYFLGLILGDLHGPGGLASLWQTASNALVFGMALLAFGWLNQDLVGVVRRFLVVLAMWSSLVLVISLIVYVGNRLGLWLINPYYFEGGPTLLLNGPFNHSNHMAYFLMTGCLASAALWVLGCQRAAKLWLALAAFLALGVVITFGRGAILGTAVGLLGMLAIRRPRLAIALGILVGLAAVAVTVAVAFHLPFVQSLPKGGFSARGELWGRAIENLEHYGPLGVGSGEPESAPGWTTHNFWLQVYGEGGVLATIGIMGWLLIPVVRIRQSALPPNLAWVIVAAMVGLMVHGIFWTQVLNGLRFLTLVFVCLWTALATRRVPEPSVRETIRNEAPQAGSNLTNPGDQPLAAREISGTAKLLSPCPSQRRLAGDWSSRCISYRSRHRV